MSLRPGAPYADRVEDDGRILIYEGHDEPRRRGGPEPKSVDQPRHQPSGRLTENGRFEDVAQRFKAGTAPPERVTVYEKIRDGLWVYNGVFQLVDAWEEPCGKRRVFKFKLELLDDPEYQPRLLTAPLEHSRMIPSEVKRAVWKRDKGQCVECGAGDNLHFDHVIPYSRGGSSLVAENIQLLCVRHNLAKRDRIE